MDLFSGSGLFKAIFPHLSRPFKSLLTSQVEKQIGSVRDRFAKEWGVPSPDLDGVLQEAIGHAYVATIRNLVHWYLMDESKKVLRTQEDYDDERRLTEALQVLAKKPIREIAPTMETKNLFPTGGFNEDLELLTALMTSVRADLGGIPRGLERRFEESLLPDLKYNLWLQVQKSLSRPDGTKLVVAFFFQALSQIQESTETAHRNAVKAAEDVLAAVSDEVTKQNAQLDDRELKEKIVAAREHYYRWILDSNATFFVPGLNIRLPIHDAWDELVIEAPSELSQDQTGLAAHLHRYHEWERLAQDARRDSHTCHAEGSVIGIDRLVVAGGPSSGKSTLARRLTHSLTQHGNLVLQISLQRVARLMRNDVPFHDALTKVGLDESGISEDFGKIILASPDYLIADGLDECDPNRTEIANHLISWASGHPNCHICVLTRPVGHTPSLLPSFTHAELLPLDDRAIDQYSERLIAQKVTDKDRADSISDEFKALVHNEQRGKRVASVAARNPLLLSFILCLFLAGKPLKEKRAQLFEQIVELIYKAPMSDRFSTIEVDRTIAERVIEATAWYLITTPDLDLRELRNTLGGVIEAEARVTKMEAHRFADHGLRFWEDRRLIERLTFGHLEACTFVHLSLSEYLAGRYIGQMGEDSLRNWLCDTRREARWRQPILMACGAGAANRIIPILLELDKWSDPISSEAVLAAFAIAESEHIDNRILEQTITHLRNRLTSPIPLIAIEAGEGLRQIAALAGEIVDAATADLVDHEQEWTRLVAMTARFAAGPSYVTVQQTQEWLKDFRFVRTSYWKRRSAKRLNALPDQAYDLQEYSLLCAIEKIFSEAPEPKKLVASTLRRVQPGISWGTTEKLIALLGRHEAADIAVKAFRLDKPLKMMSDFFNRMKANTSNGKRPEVGFLEMVILTTKEDVEQFGQQETTHISDISIPALTHLSRLISGLDFWESAYDHFHHIDHEQGKNAAKQVLRGAIIALDLDPVRLRSEAELALLRLPTTRFGFLPEVLQNIPSTPDWGRARQANLNHALVVDALSHPSLLIVVTAANLLGARVGGDQTLPLILKELRDGTGVTLGAIAVIAPQLWNKNDTAKIFLERLKGPDSLGIEYLYKPLAKLISSVDEEIAAESTQAVLAGLKSRNPKLASVAAEALLVIPLTNEQSTLTYLSNALTDWTERGSWCETCDIPVRDGSCSTCSVVPPNPRSSLIKILARLGVLDTEDLLRYSEDQWHSVRDIAYESLSSRAAAEPDLLRSLLARIKVGLEPYDLSTAVNLLYALLKLPIAVLRGVESNLVELGKSEIPAIRDVIASSLTAEWIPRETAIKLAKEWLSDSDPSVRSSTTKALRLLNVSLD